MVKSQAFQTDDLSTKNQLNQCQCHFKDWKRFAIFLVGVPLFFQTRNLMDLEQMHDDFGDFPSETKS